MIKLDIFGSEGDSTVIRLFFIVILVIIITAVALFARATTFNEYLCYNDASKNKNEVSDCISDLSNSIIFSGGYIFFIFVLLMFFIAFIIFNEERQKKLKQDPYFYEIVIFSIFLIFTVTGFISVSTFVRNYFDGKTKECQCYVDGQNEVVTSNFWAGRWFMPMTRVPNFLLLLSVISIACGIMYLLFTMFKFVTFKSTN